MTAKRVQIYGVGPDILCFSVGAPAKPISTSTVTMIEANPNTNTVRLYVKDTQHLATFSGLPFIAVHPQGLERCESGKLSDLIDKTR
jgi:hypothetical protein